MSHEDHDEWRPKGADETFNGYDVWDHGVWPTDLNHGQTDPDEMNLDEEE